MAISEKPDDVYFEIGDSDTMEEDDTYGSSDDSDDSQDDPSFDVLEETRSGFSNLSIEEKSKSRTRKEEEMDEGSIEGEPDVVETVVPALDAKDQKSFEVVQKIIEDGQVEKLKVDQCKVYLRKHGLRLTGNKGTLIERIKEHVDIVNGLGEKKYPPSSFVMNCKGDACTGDVVIFEQNVYEMFSIASRSATGPPCGTRIVAGRIVKESYGAAKQQHTFTIEVLWSKGEKPLPRLHPLLIKGRNLYRLKTMRQRWEDEGERQKILWEKHTRGSVARSTREARIQEKENRKALKENRVPKVEDRKRKLENSNTAKPKSQPEALQQGMQKNNQEQSLQHSGCLNAKTWKENISSAPTVPPYITPSPLLRNGNVPFEMVQQSQPLTSLNFDRSRKHRWNGFTHSSSFNPPLDPVRRPVQSEGSNSSVHPPSFQTRGTDFNGFRNCNPTGPPQRQGHEQKQQQLCRHYAKGKCYYEYNCKFLHERGDNQDYGQRNSGRGPSDLRYRY